MFSSRLEAFGAILASFSVPVFLSVYIELKTICNWSLWNASKRHENTSYTQSKKVSRCYYFSLYFQLFCGTIVIFSYNSYDNVVTQCHVHGAQGAGATCGSHTYFFILYLSLSIYIFYLLVTVKRHDIYSANSLYNIYANPTLD